MELCKYVRYNHLTTTKKASSCMRVLHNSPLHLGTPEIEKLESSLIHQQPFSSTFGGPGSNEKDTSLLKFTLKISFQ